VGPLAAWAGWAGLDAETAADLVAGADGVAVGEDNGPGAGLAGADVTGADGDGVPAAVLA
jgi:hypothetical protein